ncbi:MAG: sucrase ferredoxin [Cyanobacteria bacterium P01_G01_bin.54]
MLLQENLTDCRFCTLISQANGEDPIGTAGTADHWLVMELPQPWTEKTFQENPKIVPLIKLFKQLVLKQGILLRPVLIAPDKVYSQAGETRIIYYHRPQKQFAQFEKQEYIVPEADFTRLATAIMKQLAKQPNDLDSFASYRQETSHLRELLVCTHGNVDIACSKFGYPIYKKLREEYTDNIRTWRCSHFGGHKFAPTLLDLPEGRFWGHLKPEMLDLLVYRNGDVTGLRSHYRGWAALKKYEQIAEREIWMQEGWDWRLMPKSGQTTRKGLQGIKKYLYPLLRRLPSKRVRFFLEQWTQAATWAEVQFEFTRLDQSTPTVYQARVEVSGEVLTAAKSPKSGEEIEIKPVPQYQVSRLGRVVR